MFIDEKLTHLCEHKPEDECVFLIECELPARRMTIKDGKKSISEEKGNREAMILAVECGVSKIVTETHINKSAGMVVAVGKAKDLEKIKEVKGVKAIRPNTLRK